MIQHHKLVWHSVNHSLPGDNKLVLVYLPDRQFIPYEVAIYDDDQFYLKNEINTKGITYWAYIDGPE